MQCPEPGSGFKEAQSQFQTLIWQCYKVWDRSGSATFVELTKNSVIRICIHLIRIRIPIQQFRLNTDPDLGFRKKIEKTLLLKKKLNLFLDQKLKFTYPKAFIKNIQAALKREHPALQNMKVLNFF
jgi:hypothetical protein